MFGKKSSKKKSRLTFVDLAKDCFIIDFEFYKTGDDLFPYEIGVAKLISGQIVATFHSFFDNTDQE